MSGERLFLDTMCIQALLNRSDQYHQHARLFVGRVRSASEVWITEAVLIEIGNALQRLEQKRCGAFIEPGISHTERAGRWIRHCCTVHFNFINSGKTRPGD